MIDADVVVVELLNVHCPHCQMQVLPYNELLALIGADTRSRGRIKLAGIAAGNSVAEVVSRLSVCDVCHDLHFIYVFDRSGRVLTFEPLQLTRYGNKPWRPADIEQMRRRLVGGHLAAPKPFDPTIDAVTSATITSAMIFDSLAQGEELLRELRDKGLL